MALRLFNVLSSMSMMSSGRPRSGGLETPLPEQQPRVHTGDHQDQNGGEGMEIGVYTPSEMLRNSYSSLYAHIESVGIDGVLASQEIAGILSDEDFIERTRTLFGQYEGEERDIPNTLWNPVLQKQETISDDIRPVLEDAVKLLTYYYVDPDNHQTYLRGPDYQTVFHMGCIVKARSDRDTFGSEELCDIYYEERICLLKFLQSLYRYVGSEWSIVKTV